MATEEQELLYVKKFKEAVAEVNRLALLLQESDIGTGIEMTTHINQYDISRPCLRVSAVQKSLNKPSILLPVK
jgi:hypothetical protein